MKTADVVHGQKKPKKTQDWQDGKSNRMERRLALTNKTEGEERILVGKDIRG